MLMEEPHVSFDRDKNDFFSFFFLIGTFGKASFCLNAQPWEKEFLGDGGKEEWDGEQSQGPREG